MEHLAEEIGSKICCLLETVNTAIDVPPELEKPLYSLYQIHTVKQKLWSYLTVQGIFLIKEKSYLTFNR